MPPLTEQERRAAVLRVQALAERMADRSVPVIARIRAAEEILEIGFGRKPDASRGD